MQTKFYTYLILPLIFIILLFIFSNYFFLFPTVEQEIISQKKDMIKELTYITISIMDEYNNNSKNGFYPLAEAKQQAKEKIRKMCYGEDKKYYFLIMDTSAIMVMHPYRQELEGENLSNYTDPRGKPLYKTTLEIIHEKKEGYFEYTWQWKYDSTLLLPKILFVKAFDKWGWIIGTGIYMDDIKNEIKNIRKGQLQIAFYFILVFTILTISAIIYSIKIERNRKSALNRLALSEEKFRNLFHHSNDLIIISDFQGNIIEMNQKPLKKYGITKEMFIGKRYFDFIPEKYHQPLINRNHILKTKELQTPLELELSLDEDSPVFIEINSSVFNYEGKDFILSIVRDITERKNIEKQIMNAIVTGEENERARLAKELHDGLGPFLSTIKLYFQWLGESSDTEKRKLIINKGNENISEAIAILREISNNLNPHILSDYGLMEAIQSFISKFEDNKNFKVKFSPLNNRRFSHHIEIVLYRVVIELINNTIKHANASEITISFSNISNSEIKMTYSDNGRGFNFSSDYKKINGLGLINIQNRIGALNGEIIFDTALGKGFKVDIILKL